MTEDLSQWQQQIAAVKQAGTRRHFAAGEDLLREGEVATQLFFVEKGGLRLCPSLQFKCNTLTTRPKRP